MQGTAEEEILAPSEDLQGNSLARGIVSMAPFLASPDIKLTKQVVRHLEMVLRDGPISPGQRVPSERDVAANLRVSRNTVTAAYADLEQRGLIRRIRGKGSFRCNPQLAGEGFSWSGKISSKAHLMDEPVLEMISRSRYAAVPYPFVIGSPSLECFPAAAYKQSANRVIGNSLPEALAVAPTEGQSRLRHAIAQWMKVEPNRVMITSGGQQAIDLLARCLIEPGDVAIVESPTYPGALQSLRAAGARLVGWEVDWDLDILEELLLRYKPKLLYTSPSFHNPTGRTMTLATRRGLLALAARYHLPIVEDDVYFGTYLGRRTPPESLLKLDDRSQVIHVSSFSKVLAPGLRVGWVVAPLYMVKQLSLMKMRACLFTDGMNQMVMADLLERGDFDRHLENIRAHHGMLRDVAVEAIQPAVRDGLIQVHVPEGGLYLWCQLPERVDAELLFVAAEERGVSLAPGAAFFPKAPQDSYFRLCFTSLGAKELQRGIGVLTDVLGQVRSGAIPAA